MNSKNSVVKIITNIGINGLHSVMGRNLTLMVSIFCMDEDNVCKWSMGTKL